jgi:L-ascorbate metabolism protein UlaG (beta-lactamase superfamily)
MATIRFLGHAAFHIEGEGLKGLIDPFLTGNPQASEGADGFTDLNYIFLTHGHGDHLGDTVQIAKRTGATVVANFELCHYLETKGLSCHPMHIGGRWAFPFGRVKMTPAFHGSGIFEGDQVIYGGLAGGFLVEVEGKKIYHAGDTGLTKEMELLAEEEIQVALLPIGGNFVMDEADAARAAAMIRSETVVPMHYDTFDLVRADAGRFTELVGDASRVVVLEPGQELRF